jgi:hypothetical protein
MLKTTANDGSHAIIAKELDGASGISKTTVRDALRVQREDPKAFEKIGRGKATVKTVVTFLVTIGCLKISHFPPPRRPSKPALFAHEEQLFSKSPNFSYGPCLQFATRGSGVRIPSGPPKDFVTG